MKILVTGGTGNVGRAAVDRLVKNRHEVRVIGRRADVDIPGADYRVCDVNDYTLLREQVRGMEGIVHLAAIPYPGGGPGEEIFRVNCSGTFNVYQAAAEEGIKKISCASSINALGFNYGLKAFPIQYFPIDEEHPIFTTDAYSFSKQVTEDIGDYFWRKEGISSINVRLPGVYEWDENRAENMRMFAGRFIQAWNDLMALPEQERRDKVSQVIARFDATRPDRARPMPREEMMKRWQAMRQDPDMILIMGGFGRSNFWASIDARDSAQALEKGLLADYEGSYPMFVNDSYNAAGVESELLAQVFFPEAQGRKHPLQGTETLVSIERARQIIGYEPEFSWSRFF